MDVEYCFFTNIFLFFFFLPIQSPSENVDDSGYFSLEVINAALVPWNLELVPYNSSDERAKKAREDAA